VRYSLIIIYRAELIRDPSHVAALGAWITVLAIAIDPFSQQIIHPISCRKTLEGVVANVPRANNLTGIGALAVRFEPMSLDADTTAAILIGLLKVPEAISVQCPTGNCTFPATQLLGRRTRPLVSIPLVLMSQRKSRRTAHHPQNWSGIFQQLTKLWPELKTAHTELHGSN
jgi:hypothetical protein